MKKSAPLLVILLTLFVQVAVGQDSITLHDCYKAMIITHPYGLKSEEYNRIKKLNEAIANSKYLPQIKLNAKASYQSDVIEINLPIPNIDLPSQSPDQYNAALEIRQLIYDGGSIKASKDLQEAKYARNIQQTEVDLYTVKTQVNKLFFALLILEKNKESIDISIKNLQQRIAMVAQQVENGVVLDVNLLLLQSQEIKLTQSADELGYMLQSTKEALSVLTGIAVDKLPIQIPTLTEIEKDQNSRPELSLFQQQKQELAMVDKLKASEKLPKVAAFGQLGYGQPGLSMLNNQFDSYYLVGVQLSWNVWDWHQINNQRNVYKVQQNLIDIGEKTFLQHQEMEHVKTKGTIQQLSDAIIKDIQLVELQQKILSNYATQLENGVITSTQYIDQFNEVLLAEINLNTHQIQLIEAQVNQLTIQGKI